MARSGNLKQKDEWLNTGAGWIGVVVIDGRGDHHGEAVAPGRTVWLSEEEQIATANAPVNDEDNPFANGSLELQTRGAEIRNRRPYGTHAGGPVRQDETETGATPVTHDEPPEGAPAPGEEVATPEAVKRNRRSPAKA